MAFSAPTPSITVSASLDAMELSIARDFVPGNIMLIGSRVRIQVHRSVLTLQSDFFRRILALHPHGIDNDCKSPTLHLPQKDADLIHYAAAV